MGIFYKYKCRNCGKKYTYFPKNCECCGTELSFICPMDRWSLYPEYKQTKDCEEIFQIAFPFGKKARIKELESKIAQLEKSLSKECAENSCLRSEIIQIEHKLDLNESLVKVLRERIDESIKSSRQYSEFMFQNQRPSKDIHTTVSQDTIDAVRYAMKKSHPDSGGNADDFVRFQKCYEELRK